MQKHAYGCHQMVAQIRASKKFGICCSSQCDRSGFACFLGVYSNKLLRC